MPKRYLVRWTEHHEIEVTAENEHDAEESAREEDYQDTIVNVETDEVEELEDTENE